MELRTEIEIDAPPAAVWAVLVDTARYHEWNPFIPRLDGALEPGSRLDVTLTPPDASDMDVHPRVLRCAPNEELRWRGNLAFDFLFFGEHFFKLVPTDDGRTRFVHGEDFGGLLVRYLGKTLTATARGFVFMNQALKKRVEESRAPARAARS